MGKKMEALLVNGLRLGMIIRLTTVLGTFGILPGIANVVPSSVWSGYVVEGPTSSVTAITGSWRIPTVTCNGSEPTSVIAWVGMDGLSNTSVEQIGTGTICTSNGPEYYAWFEFFPNEQSQKQIPACTPAQVSQCLTLHPEDIVSAAVSYTAGTGFTVVMKDTTTGQSFARIEADSSAERASAEWIVERPQSSSVRLANFATLTFKGCYATVSGKTSPIGSYATTKVIMTSPTFGVEALPLGLVPAGAGTAFPVLFIDPYAGAVLADHPIAYYRLGDRPTATIATDFSGNGHSGTYENGALLGVPGLISDTSDTAVNFSTGDVAIPDSSTMDFVNSAFSIEAWFNANGTLAGSNLRIFDKALAGSGIGYGLDLSTVDQRLIGCPSFDPHVTISNNSTYHIVMSTDGAGTASYYLNGQFQGSGPYGSCPAFTQAAHIAVANDGSAHFTGTIDEVAIYNYELAPERISAHYSLGTAAEP